MLIFGRLPPILNEVKKLTSTFLRLIVINEFESNLMNMKFALYQEHHKKEVTRLKLVSISLN
jgi:hypothetical protein